MAKVKFREYRGGGGSGGGFYVKIVEIGDKDALPDGAVKVTDETPVCDWRHELPGEAPAE